MCILPTQCQAYQPYQADLNLKHTQGKRWTAPPEVHSRAYLSRLHSSNRRGRRNSQQYQAGVPPWN
jgi:hypothetical protein